MFRICDYVNRTLVSGDVGIEIETEFRNEEIYNHSHPPGWSRKSDGSLRYLGLEWVSKGAFALGDVPTRVKKLCEFVNRPVYSIIPGSPRTSVHVHVNVGDLSPLQTITAATAYWLLENLLIKHCGEETREGHNYCQRLTDVEAAVEMLLNDLKSQRPFFGQMINFRYVSQNMSSIAKHSTIEYRGMRGLTDPDIISDWAISVHNLSRKALEFESPDKLFEWYERTPVASILDRLFPLDSFKTALKTIPNWEGLMADNIDLVDSLAYAQDWPRWAKKIEDTYGPNRGRNSIDPLARNGSAPTPPSRLDSFTIADVPFDSQPEPDFIDEDPLDDEDA